MTNGSATLYYDNIVWLIFPDFGWWVPSVYKQPKGRTNGVSSWLQVSVCQTWDVSSLTFLSKKSNHQESLSSHLSLPVSYPEGVGKRETGRTRKNEKRRIPFEILYFRVKLCVCHVYIFVIAFILYVYISNQVKGYIFQYVKKMNWIEK